MATMTLSVDRTSLTLAALVLSNDEPSSGLWIKSAGRPSRLPRNVYAEQSPYLDGAVLTHSTLDQSSLSFTIAAKAATYADLEALQDEAEAAFGQFVFDATHTVNGVARVWACDRAGISWDPYDPGEVDGAIASGSLTIPVYPHPGA